jgi:hypothetical protein
LIIRPNKSFDTECQWTLRKGEYNLLGNLESAQNKHNYYQKKFHVPTIMSHVPGFPSIEKYQQKKNEEYTEKFKEWIENEFQYMRDAIDCFANKSLL